jgi:uncharacterized protein
MSDIIINFKDIDEHGPQTYRGTFEAPAGELNRDEVIGSSSVDIDVTVKKGDLPAEYIADGKVALTADLTCSRCADPYPFANNSDFHVRFRPRPEPAGPGEEEVEINDREELDVEFYTERVIPLRDLAIEQIQLTIPMKPLCDDQCLGLCSHCGSNKARETCSCETSVVDERWSALAGLRDELSKKKNI